eukprot:TRINITY_DN18296_c0_g1_i1.p1 TRINITY_DN18296_c0_g1~~TRINITY_DN18296_c0_g1_i1.p1  ORF type:complete len:173 (-),score=31.63 TRINITY_DN18296_c0_g1_i1:268-726(-)
MADQENQEKQKPEEQEEQIKAKEKVVTYLSIWPPSDRTREAVIKRLVETLSSPSVLSKRYGSLPLDEASSAARSIEQEAFSAASVSYHGDDDDGIEILQIYSKEISKRMLDSVKSRAPPPPSSSSLDHLQTPPPVPATNEDISSVESESSQS